MTHRAGRIDLVRLLTVPGTVALPEPLAETLGAAIGSRLTLVVSGREQTVEVAGIVEVDAARREVAGNFLFADIATAQELTGLARRITRIDLVLTDAEAAALEVAPIAGDAAARRRLAGHRHRRDDTRLPDQPDGAQPARPGRRRRS